MDVDMIEVRDEVKYEIKDSLLFLFYFFDESLLFIHWIIEALGGFTKSTTALFSLLLGDPPLEIGFSVTA